jgi:hypothetical protein
MAKTKSLFGTIVAYVALVFSLLMLLVQVLGTVFGLEGAPNPPVIGFWLLVGLLCVYVLFVKPRRS